MEHVSRGKATSLDIDSKVKARFPDLQVLVSAVKNVTVKKMDPRLEAFKEKIIKEVRKNYKIESLKDEPILRAYRDFFWEIKVDPTKNRPAAEALIRRLVNGNPLPCINTLVDAYNLASIKTEIAIAAFDEDKILGNLIMRFSEKDEKFLGIGMRKPLSLRGDEIVISDEEKIVAIYPYRDAEASKITEATANIILLFCGVPGISQDKLYEALVVTCDFIKMFCGGTLKA
ncbi:MAG: phenylalanine--tRNA ligase beta subunit-related protein [Candidatus Bathyarchaeia archaeon]